MKVIAIATNGFVYIGEVEVDNVSHLRLTDAYNIRKFGTTRGLGQIALEGPTRETVLDPCGIVELNQVAVIGKILCQYGG